MISQPSHCARPFQFERDTFAFRQRAVLGIPVRPGDGEDDHSSATIRRPTYAHRCFVMVRSARQFYYHARFEPAAGRASGSVSPAHPPSRLAQSRAGPARQPDQVVIPGYDGLRSFSQAHEPLLKAECGGPWASYFLRSHWRMVFPIWRRHQERMAQQLK